MTSASLIAFFLLSLLLGCAAPVPAFSFVLACFCNCVLLAAVAVVDADCTSGLLTCAGAADVADVNAADVPAIGYVGAAGISGGGRTATGALGACRCEVEREGGCGVRGSPEVTGDPPIAGGGGGREGFKSPYGEPDGGVPCGPASDGLLEMSFFGTPGGAGAALCES